MVCQKCRLRDASVHVTSWRRPLEPPSAASQDEDVDLHFCEECASVEAQTNPHLNPLLRCGPGACPRRMRVIDVNPTYTLVKPLSAEPSVVPEELALLTSRLPNDCAVVGLEFEVICNDAQLDWLRGLV